MSYTRIYKNENSKFVLGQSLSTECFCSDDVEFLRNLFKCKYNFDFSINVKNNLILFKQGQIYKFCKMIELYIVDCFKYKVRCLYNEEWVERWSE